MDNALIDTEEFRDHIPTVDKRGKRLWVTPKNPKGKYTNYRTIVSVIFLIALFSGPFISINGHPFLMINIPDRKFFVFGLFFTTQDFPLFALAMVTGVVFIALFTAIFGRLFCGWVCPQTVFMEMVFRKIEFWIEGDYTRRKALDKSEWTTEKIKKRGLKHFIFILISFLIANTFLAYIIGIEELKLYVVNGPFQHAGTFFALVIFTGIFYFVFSWMREQICTIVCPYGRLQSVLLDQKSVVVAYDFVRGEERGNPKKEKDKKLGDCIDCGQCVNVCPTGIDIRNGTQLECVGCTACIDSCDEIMTKINRPTGLIRYASMENIKNKAKFKFTLRMIAYSVVLSILAGILFYQLATRKEFTATVLRAPGTTYQTQPDGKISNLYNIKLNNKTYHPMPVKIKLLSHKGEIKMIGHDPVLQPGGVSQATFLVLLDPSEVDQLKIPIKLGIYEGEKLISQPETTFFGPVKK